MGLGSFPGIGSAFYDHLVIIFCFEFRKKKKSASLATMSRHIVSDIYLPHSQISDL